MASRARPKPGLSTERRFFIFMAAALAVATFIGFAPTYYLPGPAEPPSLGPILPIHAALCTGWILFFALQTGLVATRRMELHRLGGTAGLSLAAGVAFTGFAVGILSARTGSTMVPGADPYAFLTFPCAVLFLFTLFVGLGVVNRHRPDVHKRMMLLATISMVIPALARLAVRLQGPWLPPGPVGGMMFASLFLLALIAFDLATRRRLHLATMGGGALLLLSEPLRVLVGSTALWHVVARGLIG